MQAREQVSETEVEEKKKIDLRIEVEDFGPISSGEITLKPLTVFIGPNNSGKSYAAMLIHSIFRSYAMASLPKITPFLRHTDISPITELRKRFDDLRAGEELDIPRKFVEVIAQMTLEALYQEGVRDEIARSFACPLNELVRIGKGSFALKISHDSCSTHLICQEGELRAKIREYPQLDIKIRVKANLDRSYAIGYIPEVEQKAGKGFELRVNRVNPSWLQMVIALSDIYTAKALENVATQYHYLPAGRSRILQLAEPLRTGMLEEKSYAYTEKAKIPEGPGGLIYDFLLSIARFSGAEGPFCQLAQDFEEEMTKGKIISISQTEDGYAFPLIRYSYRGTDIPLHRSSSSVSELAPLFLYLKYVIEPNSILIIEEPEAHLHPGNQRTMARLLVRLVRKGVNVIITTHSEYLLEQLRNFILLSKIEPEKRIGKYEYSKDDFLKPDEFAAYVFHYDTESAGHKIDKVEITEDGEISQDEFVNIIDALYEETIKLRIDLSDEA